ATSLAVIQRGLRNGQRDRIAQVLALEELRARGRGDGAGEGDEGEAGGRCGHESILLVFGRSFALAVTAQPRSLFHSGRLVWAAGRGHALADKPPCKWSRPARAGESRSCVAAPSLSPQSAGGSG